MKLLGQDYLQDILWNNREGKPTSTTTPNIVVGGDLSF